MLSRRKERLPEPDKSFWALSADTNLALLNSGRAGLSPAEAHKRLGLYGVNAIRRGAELNWLRLLLRQYQSPLVMVLVFAASIALILQDWTEATIILAIVAGSSLLGFSQEYRANRSMQALRRRLALTARVCRQGRMLVVPVEEIVPGDIVMLSAGNLVPADGLILEAKDFMVVEAALTGESFPVEKRPDVLPNNTVIAKRSNCVYLGTSVRSGTATVLIVETGGATVFGAIAEDLRKKEPETAFMRGVRSFGYMLLQVVILLGIFALVINLLLQRPFAETLLFSIALAVGVSPELLPAIVSVTLSAGARRMAEHGVIVRKLEAIENLGGLEVLCVDKTGTITKGEMEFCGWIDAAARPSTRVRYLAQCNSTLETGIENPLDAAVMKACERDAPIPASIKRDEIPYDFLRKRLTIAAHEPESGLDLLICKGAFDNILAICTRFRDGEKDAPLTADARQKITAPFQSRSEQGYRVLGIASKRVEPKPHYGLADENAFCFEGLLLFADPIKPDAKDVIERLRQDGIALKIITGDNRYISKNIAAQVGLKTDSILTGEMLAAMSDEALVSRAPHIDLFAEIDPQGKERIVRLLRQSGKSVGFLGDGINDAPALHAADVGISVDRAVDVARESADIVLLESSLATLHEGISDGRSAFGNTQKYLCITTSANFGNMLSMALITPLLPFLPMIASQILLNNLLSDVPLLAVASDNVDESVRAEPQRWDIDELRKVMIIFGLVSTIFDLLAFTTLIYWFHADQELFRTTWFVFSLLTELLVILVLRSKLPFYKSRPSWTLISLIAALSIVAVVLPFVPLATPLQFTPIAGALVFIIVVVACIYAGTTELVKAIYFRTSPKTKAAAGHG